MSYDIYAVDKNGKVIEVEKHNITGGTYAVGGTTEAYLNITFNYSKFYYKHINKELGLKFLDSKKILETINLLKNAVNKMEGFCSKDYWEPFEGNARKALCNLLIIGIMAMEVNKEARWSVRA